MSLPTDTHACFAVLALERRAESPWAQRTLDRSAVQALAARIAANLATLLPGAPALDLALPAALFDPAELLRPGWPVHTTLLALAEPSPGERGGRVIALGAHQGRMADPLLEPDPRLADGLLGVMPLALFGAADSARELGAQMEARLLDVGMADAATALALQQAFSTELEHCRFLSLHDLCAMTAMQYQHAGLDGLWALVEAALLSPERVEWFEAPGFAAAQRDGSVYLAQQPGRAETPVAVRQLEAILGVHGIPVVPVALPPAVEPRHAVRQVVEPVGTAASGLRDTPTSPT